MWSVLQGLNQGQNLRGDVRFSPLLSAGLQQQIIFWTSVLSECIGETEADGNLLPPRALQEIEDEIARLNVIFESQLQAAREAWRAPERDAEPDNETPPHLLPIEIAPLDNEHDAQLFEIFEEYVRSAEASFSLQKQFWKLMRP